MFCRFGFDDDSRPVAAPGLIERGVQPAGLRIDQLGQRVDVRAFELGELPVFEHLTRDFVLRRQALQHVGRGGNGFAFSVLHGRGQVQVFEQNLAKLRRRINVERLSRQLVDLRRQPLDVGIQLARQHSKLRADRCECPVCSMRASTPASGRSMVS